MNRMDALKKDGRQYQTEEKSLKQKEQRIGIRREELKRKGKSNEGDVKELKRKERSNEWKGRVATKGRMQ